MSDENKKISPRDAAIAVLKKAHEVLAKSEVLHKYETENKKPAGNRYGPLETNQKAIERDYDEYNVKSGNYKDSNGKRLERQISPSKNPKEEAEGNNQPEGAEPYYEFKDKIAAHNAKEKNMRELDKNEKMAKKYEGFKAVEESARESGDKDPAAVAAAAGRKKYGKEAFQHAAAAGKKMGKAENPDEKEDAELGENVEHLVEDHMIDNADAERKEGHKIMKKSDGKSKHDRCVEDVKRNSPDVKNPHAVCVAEGVKPEKWSKSDGKVEGETEHAVIPRLVLSAKLAKFMEFRHAKKRAREAAAAGQKSSDAPTPGSTQAGQINKKEK